MTRRAIAAPAKPVTAEPLAREIAEIEAGIGDLHPDATLRQFGLLMWRITALKTAGQTAISDALFGRLSAAVKSATMVRLT